LIEIVRNFNLGSLSCSSCGSPFISSHIVTSKSILHKAYAIQNGDPDAVEPYISSLCSPSEKHSHPPQHQAWRSSLSFTCEQEVTFDFHHFPGSESSYISTADFQRRLVPLQVITSFEQYVCRFEYMAHINRMLYLDILIFSFHPLMFVILTI
jgi:hypothetical protein